MLAQKAPADTVAGPEQAETAETVNKTHTNAQEDPEQKEDTRQKEQRRLAPRSSNQFRVGPPFCGTSVGCTVFIASKPKVAVVPKISARLDRGFDMIEGEWIGYKRNYFTLVAAFQFTGLSLGVTATDSFVYVDTDGISRPLCAFKISLTSVCLEDNSTAVTLVQHTAKRDRGPQSAPPLYYAVPGELPAHSTMKSVANIRNGDKIDRCNRLFYLSKEDHARAVEQNPKCILATYPTDCEISLVARYERIQFSSAGCGNRKSASTNNKHYVLVVQLLGITVSGSSVVLASTQSPPLIVRGRSPSNYPISDKKEVRAELALVKTSISNLVSREIKEETEEAGVENEVIQKKRKLKPASSLPISVAAAATTATTSKPPRHILGVNQNILNTYTADTFDPELLVSPPKARAPTVAFHKHWDRLNVATQRPEIFHPYSQQSGAHKIEYMPSVHASPELIIAQENLFPFIEGESPILHNTSYSFISDGEPMNINHSAFPSSRDIHCSDVPRGYEEAVFDLEDWANSELDIPYDCYSSLPVPLAFPETLRTSTPLQLQVMQPSLARNLHPAISRCKHGFKQREKPHSIPRHKEKMYTFADLNASVIADTEFVAFKKKLSSFRSRFTDQSPQTSSLRSSPLTMLSSDNEALFLNGLRGQSTGPSLHKS